MSSSKLVLSGAAGAAAAGEGLNVEDVFSVYSYVGDGRTENVINNIALTSTKNDGGSVYFDGSGDYLRADAALDFHNFTNEPFCIEFWIYPEIEFTNAIIPIGINAASDGENVLLWRGRSVWYRDGTGDNQATDNLSCQPPVNQWTHVALTSNGGDFKIFHNGTRVGDFSLSSSWNIPLGSCVFGIGAEFDSGSGGGPGNYFKGYISNLRVSNIQRYTTSFVPPSSAFADPASDTEIEFLALRGSTPLTDESDNSVSITTFGDAAADTTFGPFEENAGSTGGLVITKNRTNNNEDWKVYDTERTNPYSLEFNKTTAEENLVNSVSIAFNPDGFTYYGGGDYSNWNGSNKKYISYTFKKAEKFFDCQTYTGNGTSGRTISHNLGTEPAVMIVKRIDTTAYAWVVYHHSLDATSPENYYMNLNNTNQRQTASNKWNNTAPTSTEFTLGNAGDTNASGGTYVAYLFAHNDGDANFGSTGDQDIIKCGSYTGNGSSTGPSINLGFEPQWIFTKRTDNTSNWKVFDNMRGISSAGNDGILKPNLPDAEETTSNNIDLTANGFQLTTTDIDVNASSGTYIYIAIRRGPMAVPTNATDVFALDDTFSSGDPEYYSGWPVDFWMRRYDKTSSVDYVIAMDRLRDNGKLYLQTHSNAIETSYSTTGLDQMEGASLNGVANSMAWMWRRAPNYFDVLAYKGTSANRTLAHGLSAVPEMMWIKKRDGLNKWKVYHSALGATKSLELDTTVAAETNGSSLWNSTAPTSSVISLGGAGDVNSSVHNYIAYLFASLDGVSKVGSYTGNGSTQNIECGFSNGARFILIKRTDAADEWVLHDSEQGIVAGNDPYIFLNATDAQASGNDVIDPYSGGFTVNNYTAWNASGASYIFYAIA